MSKSKEVYKIECIGDNDYVLTFGDYVGHFPSAFAAHQKAQERLLGPIGQRFPLYHIPYDPPPGRYSNRDVPHRRVRQNGCDACRRSGVCNCIMGNPVYC